MAVRIGELLLKEKRITPEQLQEALSYQRQSGGKLGANLVKLGFVKDEEITSLLSKQYGVPSISLNQFEIDPAVIKLVPAETAHKYQIIPLSRVGATLTIAMTDPTNVFALDDLKFMTGYNVEPVVAWETAVLDAIQKYYGAPGSAPRAAAPRLAETAPARARSMSPPGRCRRCRCSTRGDVEVLDELEEISAEALTRQGEEAPVIKLVNVILMSAISKGASDIHVEPYEKEYRVRYRIDGILYNVMSPSLKMRDAITSRIKIMAKLDIAEKRLPQDGRIKIRFSDGGVQRDIDFRVSLPADALRREDRHASARPHQADARHDQAGLRAGIADQARDARSASRGAWCWSPGRPAAARPTRSTRRSPRINTPETNIMTAEDPVEFNLVGVNQVQVRESIGLNFAAALRSFLRQDPNIILVGEIRDFETAEIAVKAALTGHLVLSTLHTNDAPSTINRLMNMGIEPFLVASSLNLVCAQRLVRRICTNCKIDDPVPSAALVNVGFSPELAETVVPKKGKGCEKCNRTGYKGRVGLYEVMDITEELRELILVGASALELRRKAIEEGMITLRGSGLRKITDGVTTLEEVVRETVK